MTPFGHARYYEYSATLQSPEAT